MFALDVDRLVHPAVTFCSARRDGELLGVGALKELDATHGELKSMRTRATARGQGIASRCSRTSWTRPAGGGSAA